MLTNRTSIKPIYGRFLTWNSWKNVQLLETLKKRFENMGCRHPVPLQRSMALGGRIPDKKTWWKVCMYPNNEDHLVKDR